MHFCGKYRIFKNRKILYIFKKVLGPSLVCSKCRNECKKKKKKKKKIKEEELNKILKILGVITSTEEYQNIYQSINILS